MGFQKSPVSINSSKAHSAEVEFKGHHPGCEEFSANRITIGRWVFCAACSGLLAGAVVAMVGVVLFSLHIFDFGSGSLGVLLCGEGLMLAGLAQTKLSGYIKLTANALFVVGSFFSLVAADLVGQSLMVDAYVLGLIVFLLWFRILLSEWNNKRTCLKCGHCI
jgi:hypothetical protein